MLASGVRMPSKDKDWDEDPWDHMTSGETLARSLEKKPLAKAKGAHYVGAQTSYPLTSVSAAVIKAIRDAVREETSAAVESAFQRIMDRLEELEEEITRVR